MTAVTDSAGTVVERLAYDSFGKRRSPAGPADPGNTLAGNQTDRGYTNHQHLDDLDLINTNGRIYDPTLGRFMSADPFVQVSGGLQSYNRYSYVSNNPLVFTDPSGYIFGIGGSIKGELKRWERDFRHEVRRPNSLLGPALRVAGAAASVLCNGAYAACVGASEAAIGRAQGVKGSALLRSTAIAAASAYALNQTGSITAAGAIGGVASVLSTGDIGSFGGGFAAGALSAAVPLTSSDFANIAISATVGGTASELTGGKFANGAITVAFAMTLRSLPDIYKDTVGYELDGGPGGAAVGKDPLQGPVQGANNIGTQQKVVDPACTFCEGGSVSRAANQAAGVNAVAGMHDVFQVSLGTGLARDIFNIPGMPIAAALTSSTVRMTTPFLRSPNA